MKRCVLLSCTLTCTFISYSNEASHTRTLETPISVSTYLITIMSVCETLVNIYKGKFTVNFLIAQHYTS